MKNAPKFLTREEERNASAHTLVVAHRPMVATMAKNFARYGAEVDDLMQEGGIGLMMAAERFDSSLNIRFSTYARFWVRQKMREHVVGTGRPVRIPASTQNLKRFFSGKRVFDLSLDSPSGIEGSRSIGDDLPSPESGPDVLVEQLIDGERTGRALSAALAGLNARAADIIASRYLREEREGLEEIGQRYGISKERVRQIEVKALQDLRKRMEG